MISHYYRDANKAANQLANMGVGTEREYFCNGCMTLPSMVCRDVRLDRLEFSNFRRKVFY